MRSSADVMSYFYDFILAGSYLSEGRAVAGQAQCVG